MLDNDWFFDGAPGDEIIERVLNEGIIIQVLFVFNFWITLQITLFIGIQRWFQLQCKGVFRKVSRTALLLCKCKNFKMNTLKSGINVEGTAI